MPHMPPDEEPLPYDDNQLTITELARCMGLTPRAIRFYEDKQLLSPGRIGRMRIYTEADKARLHLIARAKRLGFPLREIREWLALYDAIPQHKDDVGAILLKARNRIAGLERRRADLETALDELREFETMMTDRLRRQAVAPPAPPQAHARTVGGRR